MDVEQFIALVRTFTSPAAPAPTVSAAAAAAAATSTSSSWFATVATWISVVALPITILLFIFYAFGILKTVVKYAACVFASAFGLTTGVLFGVRVVLGDEFLARLVRDCSHVKCTGEPPVSRWWT
jgi:hypothetical protein